MSPMIVEILEQDQPRRRAVAAVREIVAVHAPHLGVRPAAGERVDQLVGIDPAAAGVGDYLRPERDRSGDHRLIARFRDLPAADAAHVRHVARVGGDPRLDPRDVGRRAAHEYGERSGGGADGSARDRRVDPADPAEPSRREASRVVSGWIVEWSTIRLPRRAPSATPCGPNTTSSTAGPSVTHSSTASHCAASSAGDAAELAPASSAGFSRSGVRPQTTTWCPAPISRSAMGFPMSPSPIHPSLAMSAVCAPGIRPPTRFCVCRGRFSARRV